MVVLFNIQNILDGLPSIPSITLPILKENGLKIEYHRDDDPQTVYTGVEPPLPFANSKLFHANISHWRRLTAVDDRCKAVYEVAFDVTDSNFVFKAGDTIGIVPENTDEEVNTILSHIDLVSLADVPYKLNVDSSLKGCKIPLHIPMRSTLSYLLKHCVDLRSVLKKLFLLALSRFTKDEEERKVLEYFCSKEGSTAYQTHVLNRNLCLLDIFHIFKSCKPTIEVLIANLPRLLPRPYSIVNTGQKDSNSITICFSAIDMENSRRGLTTGWLENILNNEFDLEKDFMTLSIESNCDSKIPIYLRKNMSAFNLPQNLDVPLIFIGPGTGVAPFIGFLEEIELAKDNNPNTTFGDVWLFFGCRDPSLDFIYKAELEGFHSRGVLNKLCTAFSRTDDSKNRYVQDALFEEGESIAKLINDGAFIFISGDLKNMAIQIKETFLKCLITYDGKTQEEADKLLCDMVKEKRYCVDAWS